MQEVAVRLREALGIRVFGRQHTVVVLKPVPGVSDFLLSGSSAL